MRNGARPQRHRLIEHDRAGACIDDDLGRRLGSLDRHFLDLGNHAHARAGIQRRIDLHRAAVQCHGRACAHALVDGAHHLVGGLEVGLIQTQRDRIALLQRRADGALYLRALRHAACIEVIDLYLGAAGRSTRAAHHHIALGQRIDLAIGTAQRRGHQRAALERLGVAHGRDIDVNGLARLRKRRQLGRDDDGGHVLELQLPAIAGSWQRDAHLLQIVGQGLLGIGHLRGLVARSIEADHQAITRQLVAAHPLNGCHLLDACGMRRQGEPAGAQGSQHQNGGACRTQ